MYAKFELSFSPGRSSISVTIAGPAPAGRTTGGAAGAALAALFLGGMLGKCKIGRCWAQRRNLQHPVCLQSCRAEA